MARSVPAAPHLSASSTNEGTNQLNEATTYFAVFTDEMFRVGGKKKTRADKSEHVSVTFCGLTANGDEKKMCRTPYRPRQTPDAVYGKHLRLVWKRTVEIKSPRLLVGTEPSQETTAILARGGKSTVVAF